MSLSDGSLDLASLRRERKKIKRPNASECSDVSAISEQAICRGSAGLSLVLCRTRRDARISGRSSGAAQSSLQPQHPLDHRDSLPRDDHHADGAPRPQSDGGTLQCPFLLHPMLLSCFLPNFF